MKKVITLLFLMILTAASVSGQTETEIMKKAQALISKKKYESAFKILETFDPKNGRPDIVLLKVDIVLNYFVTSIMHQMFALTDLKESENIMDYRGKEGSFNMHKFEVNEILNSLIKTFPNNCALYKSLGEFYYEAHLKYEGKWLEDDGRLFKLMEVNFTKAVESHCADYLSFYILGYITLSQNEYKKSVPYFVKAIDMNSDYASSHYNLAYAYLYTNDRQNALKYAKNSFDLYKDQTYKSDAARMMAQIYTELKDDKNALNYYELADTIDSGNYYNMKPLLNLYVKTGSTKTNETAKDFLNLDPENPTMYNDLADTFYENKRENDLITFYKDQLIEFKDNNKVLGNLNFYLGKIYLDIDKTSAKEYFLKAQNIFNKVFDKDHPVFKAIEEGIKQAEK